MWHSEYVGIRYSEKGASRCGVSCWGLVCLVYREQLGIDVYDYSCDYDSPYNHARIRELADDESTKWIEVDKPEPFDVLEFLIAGKDLHVGIAINETKMLHAGAYGKDVCIENYTTPQWRNKLKSIWRRCK